MSQKLKKKFCAINFGMVSLNGSIVIQKMLETGIHYKIIQSHAYFFRISLQFVKWMTHLKTIVSSPVFLIRVFQHLMEI